MPRTLPWKRAQPSGCSSITTSSSITTPSSSSSSVAPLPAEVVAVREAGQSRSPSPPPDPPEQSFMVDGLQGDDVWRMVEDEFLAVARTFTAQLHRAEYKRLRLAASAQNAAGGVQGISRPPVTDHDMTGAVGQCRGRQDLHAHQTQATKRKCAPTTDHDGPTPPWAGTSLQGLMDRPRRRAPRLLGDPPRRPAAVPASPTRRQGRRKTHVVLSRVSDQASAVDMDQSTEDDEKNGLSDKNKGSDNENSDSSDEDDDLDAPSGILPNASRPPASRPTGHAAAGAHQSWRDGAAAAATAAAAAATARNDSDSSDEGIIGRARKRRAARERLAQQQKRDSSDLPDLRHGSTSSKAGGGGSIDFVPIFT